MKTFLRWVANSLAFYLALYLVDSIAKGRIHVGAVWIVVLVAIVLGFVNALIHPLYRVKSKPFMAIIESLLTIIINAVVLQIPIWAGAPVSASNIVWVFAMAAFLTVLGGVLNWLIGFKKKETPGALARERRAARAAGEREGK